MEVRDNRTDVASRQIFDVAIIGGGINGACLYDRLRREGRRVILIDKGDFGSGTSQASAMMVWGGLLYLGSLDFWTVYKFSASRDRMFSEMSDWASPRLFRFLPAARGKLGTVPVLTGLYLYWLIGSFQRKLPTVERDFPERGLLARDSVALLFEEGQLRHSDARFVLHWIIRSPSPGCVALNYCELDGGDYHQGDGLWHLAARDRIGDRDIGIRARAVVNCAGVWSDRINAAFGISSAYKHVLSKGVFLGLKRPTGRMSPLIFDTGAHDDVITSIPWGPIELWGPTETEITGIEEGLTPSAKDLQFLLEQYDRCYKRGLARDDIVSLRCGIRPLAVEASYAGEGYPLELSRRDRVAVDDDRPWVSVYGGKLTGCESAAAAVSKQVASLIPASDAADASPAAESEPPPLTGFPGLDEKVPEVGWCMQHEACCTLEDYLRRRTNIAQWVPREGLGRADENLLQLREICLVLTRGDEVAADRHLAGYRREVARRFDRILDTF